MLGFISINASSLNSELCKNYNSMFINKFQTIFKELEDATEEIERNSQALSKSVQKYSVCFEQLCDLYSDTGFDEFIDMYNQIRDLTMLYSDCIVEQARSINSNLIYDFRYHYAESEAYKELSKLRSEVDTTYNKWKNDLKYKKAKLWSYKNTQDFSKWGLSQQDLNNIDEILKSEQMAKSKMLHCDKFKYSSVPKETHHVKTKLHLLKYIENQCVKEIRRVGKLQFNQLKEKFVKISKEQCKTISKMQICWSDFVSKHSGGQSSIESFNLML